MSPGQISPRPGLASAGVPQCAEQPADGGRGHADSRPPSSPPDLVPWGHSRVAHRQLGWCCHCRRIDAGAEVLGWRTLAQGLPAPGRSQALFWSAGNPAADTRSKEQP